MTRVLVFLGAATLFAGCHNSCQDMCSEMAQYAEDQCGLTVPEVQVDDCIQAESEATSEDRAACRQFGNDQSIEEEWGCDELSGYFD